MKKRLIITSAAAMAIACSVHAADIGAAVEITAATVSNGTNSYATIAYTEGITHPAAALLRPFAVSWKCAGLTATNWMGVATGGVAWHTAAASATEAASGLSFITNEWYIRRGDTISIKSYVTNAVSVTIHALER